MAALNDIQNLKEVSIDFSMVADNIINNIKTFSSFLRFSFLNINSLATVRRRHSHILWLNTILFASFPFPFYIVLVSIILRKVRKHAAFFFTRYWWK